MNTTARYLVLVLAVVLSLHLILSITHSGYSRLTSLSSLTSPFRFRNGPGSSPISEEKSTIPDAYYAPPIDVSNLTEIHTDRHANATFVILARNSDVDGTVRSVREIEDRFNRKYRYPYVILNEVPFDENFKKRVSVVTSATVEYGEIPKEHWFQPDWIDEEKATESRNKMEEEHIIYGGSISYRNMCRFNSGFFFKHPLLQKYRWYWRIEPDVHFHCDVNYDPFLFMQDSDKIYGFTITMYEFEKTIPTLWGHVKDFMKLHPEFVAKDNSMGYLSDTGGETYNLCHFWSNFEIADMDFWRGPAYQAYFEYLDSKGGFYYERWGDAPVHSIAAGLFARRDQIHFFDSMGYEHNPYTHCPRKEEDWKKGRCSCDMAKSFDYDGYSCMRQWDRLMES